MLVVAALVLFIGVAAAWALEWVSPRPGQPHALGERPEADA
jgi:hypothetical protein